MGNLLKKIGGWLVVLVLEWLWKKGATLFKKQQDQARDTAEIRQENAQAREQTEQAQTKQERKDAAQNVIDRYRD